MTRIRHFLIAASVVLLAQPALAAEKYVFDASHSEIEFRWTHFGFSTSTGRFNAFDGTLLFDPDQPESNRVRVTIDTTKLHTGVPDLTEHLRGGDFFAVSEYPRATFQSTGFRVVGENQYEVAGNLTLHGVTRPVTLDVSLNRLAKHPMSGAKTIGFDATTTISRKAFGMGKYTPAVSDDVTIHISAEMVRESDLDS